jgi:hypothetical protein
MLGDGVGGVGDRDGDGFDDLILGASGAGPQGRGEAYIRSGMDGTLQCTLSADATGSAFGQYWVGIAGDVDADGTGDFFVTDYLNSALGSNTGRAYVYSGVDCSLLHTFTGRSSGDGFGIGRGWMGDVVADGHDDLVFGHWLNDQGVTTAGRVSIFSGRDGSLIGRFTGEIAGANLGFDVAGIGDVDGDGTVEILATAASQNGNRGVAHVLSMSSAPPRTYCTASPNSSGPGAFIDYQLHDSLSASDLRLRVTGATPNENAIFFYGAGSSSIPLNDGVLCVAGRLHRLLPASTVSAGGVVSLNLDFSRRPLASGAGRVTAGSTWNFQCWYRDPSGQGGTGSNFSDVLRVTFRP